jgi:hypothetical protein
MFKTVQGIARLTKAISVGIALTKLRTTVAKTLIEYREDPLFIHWQLALDTLIVSSREEFDEATKRLIEEIEKERRNPLGTKEERVVPSKVVKIFKPSQN